MSTAVAAHAKWTQVRLMSQAVLIGLSGLALVGWSRGGPNLASEGLVAGLFVLGTLIAGIGFALSARGADPLLVSPAVCLAGIGLAALSRIQPDLAVRQALWFVLGCLALPVTARIGASDWKRYKFLWGSFGLLLLVVTLLFGTTLYGSRSWLAIGPIQFQPSEVVKILLVLFLAGYLSDRRHLLALVTNRIGPFEVPAFRHIGPLLVVWGWFLVLFVFQRDLGTAILLFGVTTALLYVVSGRSGYLIAGGLLAACGALIAYAFFGHVRVRFQAWLNPWAQIDRGGYQIIQGLYGLAAGGVFGTGWGLGHPELIPVVQTDYIVVALAEEIGLAGALAVLYLTYFLVSRGVRAAIGARDEASSLLGFGLATLLGLQAILIVGGVTRFLPLTGVTLPFVSYGGSSMLTSFAMLGLLASVSANTQTGVHGEHKPSVAEG